MKPARKRKPGDAPYYCLHCGKYTQQKPLTLCAKCQRALGQLPLNTDPEHDEEDSPVTETGKKTNIPVHRAIHRLWGDIAVVDSKHDLRVFIRPEDLDTAIPKDPGCCVFARACQRTFGSTKVLFFRYTAYVELPDKDGTLRVERFKMPCNMRALVESFDRGEAVIPEAGFLLKAPTPAQSLEHLRSKSYQKFKASQEKARTAGQSKNPPTPGSGKTARPISVDMSVRHGTGHAQFRQGKKD